MVYTPEPGDIIILDFNPQTGHEQKGRRPALVISNKTFNRFTKLALVCPITNTKKGVPLHVPLDSRNKTTGVIMCEQIKSLDIYARHAAFVEKVPPDILEEVLDIITGFIE
ncbi:type II toxin-antitoxin system PemK/MazF family toxin [Thermosyntropha sp.]|uniref:type II toxin-antitoxin system PemK/MazF family toxin n=1 Tax=Thermosyntropha sp. TaxID=2740820 RepID=UPI0025EFE2F4|nr:type II toxin-antitoxin system PemK/MazF family toxin [Thermosyntropha sp.]MBO8159727.1 type II toxin-antitoxin system PemK/MazF family toxin [Thermosyntropha sp.]